MHNSYCNVGHHCIVVDTSVAAIDSCHTDRSFDLLRNCMQTGQYLPAGCDHRNLRNAAANCGSLGDCCMRARWYSLDLLADCRHNNLHVADSALLEGFVGASVAENTCCLRDCYQSVQLTKRQKKVI